MGKHLQNFNEIENNLAIKIERIIRESRQAAYRAVNFTMVIAYWNIGKVIVEDELHWERAEYGKSILKNISKRLTKEFGKGFDESNLRYMRLFYKTFPISDALRHELSWTHYRRDSYIRMFDALTKQDDDNPTIGLILCSEKNEAIAKYSVLNDAKQIFVSKYKLTLPTEEELQIELNKARKRFESES